ncbi:Hsp20/alpha crystallin family protein [Paenibacillus hodogayensis]|uniref:Hsp20/alpha crystallin family protein n=1 Tax=Paenibacillus hodogayensis TaxID=279208 RepID=A0ABV5W3K2_9BACL
MDDPRKDFFANFDWKSFEQFFGGTFPLTPTGVKQDASWVGNVVKDVMTKAFPGGVEASVLARQFRTEVFETHNNVIIKVYIPDKEQARNIRPALSANRLVLEGADEEGQTVHLTSPVIPDSCKAVYRDGVLQLHMKKRKGNERMHEVHVRYFE